MIKIRNVKQFSTFVGAILKIANSCKFNIDESGCTVNATAGDGNAFRSCIKIPSVTSDTKISFCIKDLSILYKSIDVMIKQQKGVESIDIEFDQQDGFIKFNNGASSFKIVTVKEVVIEKYIAQPLVSLKPVFGLFTTSKIIKQVCELQSLSSETAKVYLSKVNGSIKAELDDKKIKLINSISIPMASGAEVYGEWSRQLIVNTDIFNLFAALDSDRISISLCDKPVLEIVSISGEIELRIIAAMVKG